jgi:hypothetical protein
VSADVLNAWADDLARTEAELASVRADLRAYREIAVAALEALRRMTVERDRVRARFDELLAHHRDIRGTAPKRRAA